jgi:hypothetical protein
VVEPLAQLEQAPDRVEMVTVRFLQQLHLLAVVVAVDQMEPRLRQLVFLVDLAVVADRL